MWSDRETERDCLGFLSYVNVLAEICTHEDLAPLTLGIFGSWGSGKTSLMQMLRKRLEQANDSGTKTLWFNAWQYEGRDEAQSALVNAILARLEKDVTVNDELKAAWEGAQDLVSEFRKGTAVLKVGRFLAKGLVSLGGVPQLSEFINTLGQESQRVATAIDCFQDNFRQLLSKLGVRRVVVFIDDLDRCSAEKVIETFETIKLFLNTPSCTFVVGADAGKIEQAVGEVYSVTDARRRRDYLEKIVQIPFTIPEQGLLDIACYVGMLIVGRHLREDGWTALMTARPEFYSGKCSTEESFTKWTRDNRGLFRDGLDEVLGELAGTLPYVTILARGLRGNPRQIKRFMNILALRYRLVKENRLPVQENLVVKLAVLEYAWPDFFEEVVGTIDPESGQSPLLEEMIGTTESGEKSDSKLVTESLQVPGLVDFLAASPTLVKDFDFRPYLFLAQTSLGRGRSLALAPVEESARALVAAIVSDDPVRSRAAARRAAAQEPALAAAVMRSLLAGIADIKDITLLTHTIMGVDEICRKHRDQYPAALAAIAEIDPTDKDAVAIAAGSFFAASEKAGAPVSSEIKDKFTKSSRFAEALSITRFTTQCGILAEMETACWKLAYGTTRSATSLCPASMTC